MFFFVRKVVEYYNLEVLFSEKKNKMHQTRFKLISLLDHYECAFVRLLLKNLPENILWECRLRAG